MIVISCPRDRRIEPAGGIGIVDRPPVFKCIIVCQSSHPMGFADRGSRATSRSREGICRELEIHQKKLEVPPVTQRVEVAVAANVLELPKPGCDRQAKGRHRALCQIRREAPDPRPSVPACRHRPAGCRGPDCTPGCSGRWETSVRWTPGPRPPAGTPRVPRPRRLPGPGCRPRLL